MISDIERDILDTKMTEMADLYQAITAKHMATSVKAALSPSNWNLYKDFYKELREIGEDYMTFARRCIVLANYAEPIIDRESKLNGSP